MGVKFPRATRPGILMLVRETFTAELLLGGLVYPSWQMILFALVQRGGTAFVIEHSHSTIHWA